MNITREQACHRRFYRVYTHLGISIDDAHYQAEDWSLGGFRIGGWQNPEITSGDTVNCYFKLSFQGFDLLEDLRLHDFEGWLSISEVNGNTLVAIDLEGTVSGYSAQTFLKLNHVSGIDATNITVVV